ncbi:hypothetical protein TPAR_02354, partial [Tolypocladium paradoxum]
NISPPTTPTHHPSSAVALKQFHFVHPTPSLRRRANPPASHHGVAKATPRLGLPRHHRHPARWHARPRPRRLLPQIPLPTPLLPAALPRLPARPLRLLLRRPLLLLLRRPRALVPRLPLHRGPRPAAPRRLPRCPPRVHETHVRPRGARRPGVWLRHRHGRRRVLLRPVAHGAGAGERAAEDDAAVRDVSAVCRYSRFHGRGHVPATAPSSSGFWCKGQEAIGVLGTSPSQM